MIRRTEMYRSNTKVLALIILIGLVAPVKQCFSEGMGINISASGVGDPNQMIVAVLGMIEQRKQQQALNAAEGAAQQALQGALQVNQQAGALEAQAASCAEQCAQKKHHKKDGAGEQCQAMAAEAARLRQQANAMIASAMQNIQNAQQQQEANEKNQQMLSLLTAITQQQNGAPAGGGPGALLPVLAAAAAQQPPQGVGGQPLPQMPMPGAASGAPLMVPQY